MNRKQIEEVAEIRGQIAVPAIVMGRGSYLLVDPGWQTVGKLAEALNTDAWELWCDGVLECRGRRGELLNDKADWRGFEPLTFAKQKD